MNEVVRSKHPGKYVEHAVIERRIRVARCINGLSDNVDDITPKEALLMGMRHCLRAIRDFADMLEHLAQQPETPATIAQVQVLEAEIERQYAVMKDFARDVAGYIHPKLQATADVGMLRGENEVSVLQALFAEINTLEQNKPVPIEHKPAKWGG